MTSIRDHLSDWRFWAITILLFLIVALDTFTPELALLPFLCVPVLLAMTFAGPKSTGALAVTALYLAIASGVITDNTQSDDFWLRVAILGLVCGLTMYPAYRIERSSKRMQESETRFRLLAERVSDIVLHLKKGDIVWASPSLTDLLGWQTEEWTGYKIEDFTHPEDTTTMKANRGKLYQGHSIVERYRILGKDGTYHWVSTHSKPYLGEEGEVAGVIATFRPIDEEVAAEQELERRATYDGLTGVLLREEVMSRLENITRYHANGDALAVVFIDLDEFKSINDTLGHPAGDEVLRVIARRVRNTVRSGDTVARMGGDEFLVVLDGVHGIDEATLIAEKIRLMVLEPIPVQGGVTSVTASVGVTLTTSGEKIEAMIARADEAMYEAKRSGCNQVVSVSTPVFHHPKT